MGGATSSSVQIKLEMDPDDMFGGNHNNHNNNSNEESVMSRMGIVNGGGGISGVGPPDADDGNGEIKSDDEMSFGSLCSSETSLDIPLDTSTSERLAGMLTSRQ